MNEQWQQKIESVIKQNKVVVFMRGVPEAPRCGFSARVTKVFKDLDVPFASMDMDSDRELWQTLKQLNNWPTSPQIYINGEFVGGCDIVVEMHRTGELKHMLGMS